MRDRGVPWTQLLYRYEGPHDHLNITLAYRVSVALAGLLVASLLAAPMWPFLLAAVPAASVALWALDRSYYQFFTEQRGLTFTLRWFPLHVLHQVCNGVSFALGTFLYASLRWTGIALPGALPLTRWPASQTFTHPAEEISGRRLVARPR